MSKFEWIERMPKAELHLHIEGTLEAELLFKLAERNNVSLPYPNLESVKEAYNFTNLDDFLQLYYKGMEVLQKEEDFYELAISFLEKAHKENIRHIEPFFDPQGHVSRGVSWETMVNGFRRAFKEGQEKYRITTLPIMCFLRHLSEEDAFKTFEESLHYKDFFIAVGLDSSELENPPSKFARVFEKVRAEGFHVTAHAGEEGPASYITDALDSLKVTRVDHGVRCLEDPGVVDRLVREKIPLTVCPSSNVRLKGVPSMEQHPIKDILLKGVIATVNSDDPAYFGSYLTQNFIDIYQALNLTKEQVFTLGRNNIEASWLPKEQKETLLKEFDEHVRVYS